MTRSEHTILRHLAPSQARHEKLAVIAERCHAYAGLRPDVTLAYLDRLVAAELVTRLRKSPRKFIYKRTELGDQFLAREMAA